MQNEKPTLIDRTSGENHDNKKLPNPNHWQDRNRHGPLSHPSDTIPHIKYTVNRSFGWITDVINSVIGILSVVLAWMLYAELHARSPLMSQIAIALAMVGAIFTIIGSILSHSVGRFPGQDRVESM